MLRNCLCQAAGGAVKSGIDVAGQGADKVKQVVYSFKT